jgi:membrane-bound lytic murein transglycosylase D
MRRARRLLLAAGLLAGCAHVPGSGVAPDSSAIVEAPTQSALPAAPPAETPAETSAELAATGFADLFARMRSGFSLPTLEDLSVAREIEWYRGNPAYLDRTFSRGRRYLHYIVETLEEREMPLELALLPVVESAFDPFARSPSRASGLWQFMPSTGRRYGLDQNFWYDQRRGVLEATRAALDHLQELHDEFDGDWLLALAAYNAGALRVEHAVERNRRCGRPTDFLHLDLPRETRAYVPKLIAISRLVAEPEAFGIELAEIPNAPYFAKVDVADQIDLGLVAKLTEIPHEELRALNPELNRWATAPGGPHHLLVPRPAKERFESRLAALPPRDRMRYSHHRVQRGDTLGAIARLHGISVEALRAANRVRGSLIHLGQDLLVPIPYQANAAGPVRGAV